MRGAAGYWLSTSVSRLEAVQGRLLEDAGGRRRVSLGEALKPVRCCFQSKTHKVRPYEKLFSALPISSLIYRALALFALSPQPSVLSAVPS